MTPGQPEATRERAEPRPTPDLPVEEPAPRAPAVVTRIGPDTGWAPLRLGELWAHRELMYFLVWRQVKSEFRQMALGPLWLVIRPALSVIIYTLIFGRLAKLPSDGLPYPLFAFSAVILWTFFTSTAQSAASSLVNNQHLLTKVYFPRLVVPIVSVVTGLIPLLVSLLVLLAVAAGYGFLPRWGLLLVPVYAAITGVGALALGVWAAPWVVKYRDVAQVLDYALLGWMYATPVVYAIQGVVPEEYQTLYRLNPMTNAVQGLRWAVFGVGDAPGPMLAVAAALVALAFLGGALFFRRSERSIVDIV
jgi:lipopolysaccharide transport system permease protein